jgi:Patatin-like phospholipase
MTASAIVTYPCLPHALPFRTILGEYRIRREHDLAAAIRIYLSDQNIPADQSEPVWIALDKALTKSEDSYSALLAAKDLMEHIGREPGEAEDAYARRVELGYHLVLSREKECKTADHPLKQLMHAMEGTAVCLSGGGIRSASFSLGVLQGLARFSRRKSDSVKPLLDNLDYLSTVSGGGYIGSWMMAWARRSSFHKVVSQLAKPASTSGDPEPEPIRHLRSYTSYLTPHYGFTVDTLTLAAIVVRNMILNWLTILPVIVGLMCLPQLLWIASYAWPLAAASGAAWYHHAMWGSLFFVAVSASFAAGRAVLLSRQAPVKIRIEKHQEVVDKRTRKASRELWLFVLPLLIGSWLLGEVWMRGGINLAMHGSTHATFTRLFHWMFPFALIPPFLMSLIRLRLVRANPSPFRKRDGTGGLAWWRLFWSLIAPLLIAALASALLAGASLFLRKTLFPLHNAGSPLDPMDPPLQLATKAMLTATIPIILTVLMVAASFLSGLLSDIETEEEREWWGRAGGLLFGCTILWVALNFVSLFAHDVFGFVYGTGRLALGLSATAGLGTAAGYLGSLAGFSGATANGLKKVKLEQLTSFQKWLAKHNAIAPVMSGIALVCIMFVLADITSSLCYRLAYRLRPDASADLKTNFIATLLVLGGAAALGVLGNLFINVNTFSLHGMYRMRLTRAYLGASNFARRPDPFTNFDPEDNIYEHDVPCCPCTDFKTEQDTGSQTSANPRVEYPAPPLHVIGTALNMVGTQKLAWQQRKAESFTFSPISCGSWRLGYVRTADFGGTRGVRLGTAMAISGAAVNPNMGYHSSALVTMLMTLFNTRLGWWLPNPIWPHLQNWNPQSATWKTFLRRSGPQWALMPLLNEALGRTDDGYEWIELSDGGHFENLGLYEMVMRRCRYIVLVDADADSEYQFDDLGNALRKIEIDLGVPIVFPEYGKSIPMQKGVHKSNLYCMKGAIRYSCVDQGMPDGDLLYIKPVMNGSEPPDVRAYRANHQTFPHEPTANQFFNEAQFESYRHLGSWVFDAMTAASDQGGRDIQALFDVAADYRRGKADQPVDGFAPCETQSNVTMTPDSGSVSQNPAPDKV